MRESIFNAIKKKHVRNSKKERPLKIFKKKTWFVRFYLGNVVKYVFVFWFQVKLTFLITTQLKLAFCLQEKNR